MGALQILIAVLIGYVIWRVTTGTLRMLNTPPDIDPTDVVEVEQEYLCSICGTRLKVTVASNTETAPPRHCREDMDPVPPTP